MIEVLQPHLAGVAPTKAVPAEAMREAAWGEHACLVYDAPGEPLAAAAAYLREGLRRGERCAYVADDHTTEEVAAALREAGVEVEEELERGALILTNAAEYGRVRPFDPARMCERLRELVEEAIGAEFAGLRLAVDMTWTQAQGVSYEQLLAYEAMTNALVFARGHISAICMYNRRRFPDEVIRHALDAHPVKVVDEAPVEAPAAGREAGGGGAEDAGREQDEERSGGPEAPRVALAQAAVARRLAFLAEAGRILASSLDLEAMLSRLARLAVPAAGDLCVVDLLEDDGTIRRVATAHRDPAREELTAELRRLSPDPGASRGVARVIRTREPEIVPEVDDRFLESSVPDPERRRIVRELGVRAFVSVPMIARSRTLGAISLGFADSGRRLGPEEVSLAEELASRAALALENARLYRQARSEIAERRRAERVLRRSEERFRLMFEKNPLPMWIFDPKSLRFLEVNEAAVAHYGYSRKEFLRMTLEDIHAPEEVPAVRSMAEEPHRSIMARGESQHRKRDGSIIHVEITTQETTFKGRPARAVLAVDVTEQRMLQQAIRLTNERLVLAACREQELADKARAAEERQRFLAEAGALLVAAPLEIEARLAQLAQLSVPTLADYCIVDVVEENGGVRRVGVAHADPAKRELADGLLRFPPVLERPEGVWEALRRREPVLVPEVTDAGLAAAAQGSEHLELVRELGPRSYLCVPLTARGRNLGAVTFVYSDSDRRYGPQDLALARELANRAALNVDNARLFEDAKRALRAREEVLRIVSHELRDPLQAILLHLETLAQLIPPAERLERERHALDAIGSSANQMIRLVHDLLDVTRIEAGHFTIHPSHEEVPLLLREALGVLEPLIGSKSIRLETRVPDRLPAIHGDRQRLVQVLSNLVSNAVRHTPNGGEITVGAEEAEEAVRFWVRDTGSGIAAEDLPRVFHRSWKGENTQGMGFGLAIVRAIVEAHGGRIGVESRLGEGTEFFFTVPLAGRAPAGSGEPDDPAYERVARLAVLTDPGTREAARGTKGAARTPARTAAAERGRVVLDIGSAEREMSAEDLADSLQELIAHSLHSGHFRPGDRLPSIRELAEQFSVSRHAVVTAYAQLAERGWVEKRDRSGMYVAEQDHGVAGPLGETAAWLSDVLVEAWTHRIKVPRLSDVLRRYTGSTRLRSACIESDHDTRTELCAELTHHFGLDCSALPAERVPRLHPESLLDLGSLPAEIREADLLVTTAYHAPHVRAVAAALGRPCVVTSANPQHIAAIERRAQEDTLTVVCSDRRFGERIRSLRGGKYRDAVRVILADDAAEVARLDPAEPVLLTRAAHERLGRSDLRLLVPFAPPFSDGSAQTLARLVIRLNQESERR